MFLTLQLYRVNNLNKNKMRNTLATTLLVMVCFFSKAQTLEKMQWFNEPKEWSIKNNSLQMNVTPLSDYWRITHYGFTIDDAPFYYATYGGEFEAKVKISAKYKSRFDQSGLMLRIDHENYIKTGIEFVNGKYNLSTVVTHKTSDWNVITLEKEVPYLWIKAVRSLDAVEVFYSFDDKEYVLMRVAWLQDNVPVQVGLMGASPDGAGFTASFEGFQVKHVADKRRLQWLKNNTN